MSPRDQDNPGPDGNLPIRGVRDGDLLPALVVADTEGRDFELPQVRLNLQPARLGLSPRYGPSWVERVLALRKHYGDFQLTWFEALLRVADVRASQIAEPRDSRLPQDLVEVQSVPETQDRDAELRQWIAETLAAAAAEPQAVNPARGKAKNRTEPKPPRTSTKKSSRGARGGAP